MPVVLVFKAWLCGIILSVMGALGGINNKDICINQYVKNIQEAYEELRDTFWGTEAMLCYPNLSYDIDIEELIYYTIQYNPIFGNKLLDAYIKSGILKFETWICYKEAFDIPEYQKLFKKVSVDALEIAKTPDVVDRTSLIKELQKRTPTPKVSPFGATPSYSPFVIDIQRPPLRTDSAALLTASSPLLTELKIPKPQRPKK